MDEIFIDLDNQEIENAATKIQAGFRGHQTRIKLKNQADENNEKMDSLSLKVQKKVFHE